MWYLKMRNGSQNCNMEIRGIARSFLPFSVSCCVLLPCAVARTAHGNSGISSSMFLISKDVFSNIVSDIHMRVGLYFHFYLHFKYSFSVLILILATENICVYDTNKQKWLLSACILSFYCFSRNVSTLTVF